MFLLSILCVFIVYFMYDFIIIIIIIESSFDGICLNNYTLKVHWCFCSPRPVVVIEKVIGEGVKVKVVELGLTVILSQQNKILIKVSLLSLDVGQWNSVHWIKSNW